MFLFNFTQVKVSLQHLNLDPDHSPHANPELQSMLKMLQKPCHSTRRSDYFNLSSAAADQPEGLYS